MIRSEKLPVWFVNAFLMIYTLSPYLGIPSRLIAMGYILSSFLVIWMVVSVLKRGVYTGPAFDEGYFYRDESAARTIETENRVKPLY